MKYVDLLKVSIQKAVESSDIDFLDNLVDFIFSSQQNIFLQEQEEGLDEFLISFYEYSNNNYERAKYFASLAYLKGIKQAQIILDLIESQELINNLMNHDKIISFLIKKSDDLFILIFTILKYYKKLISKNNEYANMSLLSLVNRLIDLCPFTNNFYILKVYVLHQILNYEVDWEYINEIMSKLRQEEQEIIKHLIE